MVIATSSDTLIDGTTATRAGPSMRPIRVECRRQNLQNQTLAAVPVGYTLPAVRRFDTSPNTIDNNLLIPHRIRRQSKSISIRGQRRRDLWPGNSKSLDRNKNGLIAPNTSSWQPAHMHSAIIAALLLPSRRMFPIRTPIKYSHRAVAANEQNTWWRMDLNSHFPKSIRHLT